MASLGDAEQEAQRNGSPKRVDKGHAEREDAEAKGEERQPLSRPDALAHQVARQLKEYVGHVEGAEERVVVVAARHAEVIFELGEARIADVGSVDEAEEIHDGNDGDDVHVDLAPQPRLGLGVEAGAHHGDALFLGIARAEDDVARRALADRFRVEVRHWKRDEWGVCEGKSWAEGALL